MDRYILLVDNARFMRMMCRDILEKEGYRIAGEAASREEALEKYKYSYPDVVLLNIVMPGTNGIEVLKELKEISADAKVIMCSAMTQANMVVEALLAGAADFIAKPFQPDKLISVVDNCFTENKGYNNRILLKLLENPAKIMHTLTQDEIDNIIEYALVGNIPTDEQYKTIKKLNKDIEIEESIHNTVKNKPNDEEVIGMLDRFKEEQNDIKNMLMRLLEKQD